MLSAKDRCREDERRTMPKTRNNLQREIHRFENQYVRVRLSKHKVRREVQRTHQEKRSVLPNGVQREKKTQETSIRRKKQRLILILVIRIICQNTPTKCTSSKFDGDLLLLIWHRRYSTTLPDLVANSSVIHARNGSYSGHAEEK